MRPRRCTHQCALKNYFEAVAEGHPALPGYLFSHPKITFVDDVLTNELAYSVMEIEKYSDQAPEQEKFC